MKTTKTITVILVALMAVNISIFAKDKPKRETAVFYVEIHCDACIKKIEQNIGFEKGVKDMRINKDAETVTITYDPSKTDIDKLKAAFEKIKKPVKKVEAKEVSKQS